MSLIFLNGSILSLINKSGQVFGIGFKGITKVLEGEGSEIVERLWPLTILIILIPLLSVITICFYKKRNIQIVLAKILIGLISGLIFISAYYAYVVTTKYNGTLDPGLRLFYPFIMLIFSIIALRGIMKDDKLVKSYDRLR
jgi:Na+/H+ antiporter NhaC